jgi:predicted transcriptional regulator
MEYPREICWRYIMGAISLKLPEDVLETSRRCADTLHLSRAAYIRRAIEHMNRQTQALLRAKRLAEASKKVRKESMRVNREFAAIEQAPDA